MSTNSTQQVSDQTPEHIRLGESESRTANWKRWGPYLAERQWGTVREDYSADANPWTYFPHDHARSRAYRWGEDGLLGITDRQCRLCFSIALWNGQDAILKERLFGLTGPEGNHGEDVKECYYYLDSTPTHSWMKALYKYPQREFPYDELVIENGRRGWLDPEFELSDTGVFDQNRYFDVVVEYAKAGPDDILIQITVTNRGPDPATINVLPTLWFRNNWAWGCDHEGCGIKPKIHRDSSHRVVASHETLGRFVLEVDRESFGDAPVFGFTENETNSARFDTQVAEASPYVKDSFHQWVVDKNPRGLNPKETGTKVAVNHVVPLQPGESHSIRLRLFSEKDSPAEPFGQSFDSAFNARQDEANDFYATQSKGLDKEQQNVCRQAFAGLMWTKQFYHYAIDEWLEGDPSQPKPPQHRSSGRNHDWRHLFNRDVISMPDKWEYPWYAAWDLAFHMIPFAQVDSDFAKSQLTLFLREWYMHPSGQIPAYEFAFSDVNPPVHAWACWRVYKISEAQGRPDRSFLERVFHKLMLNFTWWVNRKDINGQHIFSGGFLGLDNVGVFDRSRPMPTGGYLEQADGTAWMAFFCGTMLSMALELARDNDAYEGVASKFFEHYVAIADAINNLGGTGLWDETDGFYYDRLQNDGQSIPLKTRSLVGLVPLFAVEILEEDLIEHLPAFQKRMNWFLENRPELAKLITCEKSHPGNDHDHGHRLLAIPSRERLEKMLAYLLDEDEFLSEFGIRSLSKVHESNPYVFECRGNEFRVQYDPAESTSGLFGGNSNWRGPIWLPMNWLIIESLVEYHHFYGDNLKVAFPTGSDNMLNLKQVADELSKRLSELFLPDENGRRPCHGPETRYANDENWKDLVLFYEFFHGDNGRGCGASHQTGWTALAINCLQTADLFLR